MEESTRLLVQAREEIARLRGQVSELAGRQQVFNDMMLLLRTSPGYGNANIMEVEVGARIGRYLEGLEMAKGDTELLKAKVHVDIPEGYRKWAEDRERTRENSIKGDVQMSAPPPVRYSDVDQGADKGVADRPPIEKWKPGESKATGERN